MTSAVLSFDRLAYIDRLKDGGIDEKQARAHAVALDAALRDTVATKSDIGDVRHEIEEVRREIGDVRRDLREVEMKLEARIEAVGANLKVEILRWLVVTQIALGGFIFAVLKFLR
jgi:predicted  nucleic acid-binding Zn-ribbon protein